MAFGIGSQENWTTWHIYEPKEFPYIHPDMSFRDSQEATLTKWQKWGKKERWDR